MLNDLAYEICHEIWPMFLTLPVCGCGHEATVRWPSDISDPAILEIAQEHAASRPSVHEPVLFMVAVGSQSSNLVLTLQQLCYQHLAHIHNT